MNFVFILPIKNRNISPGAVTEGILTNLAAVEKTKRKKYILTPVLYWHESEGNTKKKKQ